MTRNEQVEEHLNRRNYEVIGLDDFADKIEDEQKVVREYMQSFNQGSVLGVH